MQRVEGGNSRNGFGAASVVPARVRELYDVSSSGRVNEGALRRMAPRAIEPVVIASLAKGGKAAIPREFVVTCCVPSPSDDKLWPRSTMSPFADIADFVGALKGLVEAEKKCRFVGVSAETLPAEDSAGISESRLIRLLISGVAHLRNYNSLSRTHTGEIVYASRIGNPQHEKDTPLLRKPCDAFVAQVPLVAAGAVAGAGAPTPKASWDMDLVENSGRPLMVARPLPMLADGNPLRGAFLGDRVPGVLGSQASNTKIPGVTGFYAPPLVGGCVSSWGIAHDIDALGKQIGKDLLRRRPPIPAPASPIDYDEGIRKCLLETALRASYPDDIVTQLPRAGIKFYLDSPVACFLTDIFLDMCRWGDPTDFHVRSINPQGAIGNTKIEGFRLRYERLHRPAGDDRMQKIHYVFIMHSYIGYLFHCAPLAFIVKKAETLVEMINQGLYDTTFGIAKRALTFYRCMDGGIIEERFERTHGSGELVEQDIDNFELTFERETSFDATSPSTVDLGDIGEWTTVDYLNQHIEGMGLQGLRNFALEAWRFGQLSGGGSEETRKSVMEYVETVSNCMRPTTICQATKTAYRDKIIGRVVSGSSPGDPMAVDILPRTYHRP